MGNCDFVNHHKSLYLYVCWNAHILSHLITALLQLSLIPLSSLSPIKSRMTTFWYQLPRHTWKNGRWHADRQQCSHDHQEREVWFVKTTASCGLRGCKNRPALFPGRMSYKATKPGLVSVLYLSMRYTVLFIRAPFYVSLVFVAMCSVFWLFWLSCQYLPSEWLERLLWGSIIMARGSSPESPGPRVRVIVVVYCIALLFYYVFVLSPAPTWYNNIIWLLFYGAM